MIPTVDEEKNVSKSSILLLPEASLAGCIFAAVVRDTRSLLLTDQERFNYFPASPLMTLTIVFEGDIRIVSPLDQPSDGTKEVIILPPVSFSGPQDKPMVSWNPGAVFAISIGFFPEAWAKLTGAVPVEFLNQTHADIPAVISTAVKACEDIKDVTEWWDAFCKIIQPNWQSIKNKNNIPTWVGGDRIGCWAKSIVAKAAISGPGKSARATERRIRRWTGQNKQSLVFYERLENLHRRVEQNDREPLVDIANDSGFADQSHMSRTVQRGTGYPPAQLNRLIATHEAFWCYRLLGERF